MNNAAQTTVDADSAIAFVVIDLMIAAELASFEGDVAHYVAELAAYNVVEAVS